MHRRLHEVAFENPAFLRRLHAEVYSLADWQAAKTPEEQLPIIRQVFSVHTALRIFGSDELTNYKELSLLAGDNLREVIYKCDELVCDFSFRAALEKITGLPQETIQRALKDTVRTPEDFDERLLNLTKLFEAVKEKLPQRTYERVKDTGDLEAPNVTENFSY